METFWIVKISSTKHQVSLETAGLCFNVSVTAKPELGIHPVSFVVQVPISSYTDWTDG
jgi:hypothetical protein